MQVGELRAILRLDSGQFDQGIDRSESNFREKGRKIQGVGDAITGVMVGVGGAVLGAAAATAEHAREVDNFSRQSGIGVEQVQETTMAMERLGVEQDTARDGLRELNLRLGEAATDGGDAAEGFAALGVDLHDANGEIRSSRDVLPEVLQSLQSMDSDAERSAAAAKTFGDEAGFAFAQVASRGGDMEEAMDAVRDSGAIMSQEGIDQAREMSAEWDATKQVLMGWMRDAAIPAMEFFTDDLVPVVRDDVVPMLRAMKGVWDDLPDPVRGTAAALAGITAAAGPILSVSGRIMQLGTRTRGAATRLRGMATFLAGPWGVALGGAALVVGELVSAQREAARATDTLRQELEGQEASVSSLSDEFLTAQLKSQNLLATFEDQGLELDQLRQAVLGNDEAWRQMSRDLDITGNLYEGLLDIMPGVRSEKSDLWSMVLSLRSGTEQYNDSLEAERRVTGRSEEATRDARTEMERMTAEMEDADEAAGRLKSQLDILNGAERSVEQATIDWRNQLATLSDSLGDNSATLDVNTAEGRENRQAILDTVEAAQGRVQALAEDGATTDEVTAALQRHIDELRTEAQEAGLTEDQISEYIDTLNLTPEQIETIIEADTGPAAEAAQGYRRDITSLPPVPMGVGADTQPAREAIGGLQDWILSQGVIDLGMDVSGLESGGPGDGAMPPGGSVISRLNGFMDSTGIPHRTTSTFRPGDDGLHGERRAVDFAGAAPGENTPNLRSIQAAFVPLAASGVLAELIGPDASMNYKNGMPFPYPADVQEAHDNHVHTAMAAGGMIMEPVFGIGASGRSYSFGEVGPEAVIPGTALASSSAGSDGASADLRPLLVDIRDRLDRAETTINVQQVQPTDRDTAHAIKLAL